MIECVPFVSNNLKRCVCVIFECSRATVLMFLKFCDVPDKWHFEFIGLFCAATNFVGLFCRSLFMAFSNVLEFSMAGTGQIPGNIPVFFTGNFTDISDGKISGENDAFTSICHRYHDRCHQYHQFQLSSPIWRVPILPISPISPIS